jgi:pullulanase/glycogen debranching enzyme
LLDNPPLLTRIAEDPILRDVKLIAEAWDAAGAYEVGSFAQRRWAEWNGQYRDDVRRFWRGDDGLLGLFAQRICGSADIYSPSGKGLIAFRAAHPVLSKEQFYTDVEIHWFGSQGGSPNWVDPKTKQFACLIHEDEDRALHLMFNEDIDAVVFGLPAVLPGVRWRRAVDTSRDAPDFFAAGEETLCENSDTYELGPRSSVILLAR